jgi:hypothetical protein
MLMTDMSPPPPRRPIPSLESDADDRVPHVPRRPARPVKHTTPYPIIARIDPARRGQSTVIRVQRRAGGLVYEYSISKIAIGAGLSPAALSYILAGKRTGKIQTLQAIATYLGISLDALNRYLATQRQSAE